MNLAPLTRATLKLAWALLLLVAGLRLLAQLTVEVTWDDAHMFGRYAANLLHGDGIAWNPSGQPTYGLTSLHFLWIVVPLRSVFAKHPGLATSLGSLIPAIVFLVIAVPRLAGQRAVRRTDWIGPSVLVGFVCLLVRGESPFFVHAGSGMDTAFAMLFVAAYLLFARSLDEMPTPGKAVGFGLLGAATFGVRPDLLVFATVLPVAIVARDRDRLARRWCALALGITILGLCLQLGFNAAYFRSIVPLPFHAKATGLYRSELLVERYKGASAHELAIFFEAYWPALVVVALDVVMDWKSWLLPRRRLEASVLVATLVFGAFYAGFVMSIMGYFERFYMPLLPALFFLAAGSARELASRLTRPSRRRVSVVTLAVAAAVVVATAPVVRLGAQESVDAHHRGALGSFDVGSAYRQRHADYWYCLDEVAALPDDLVIATTEVGFPGALAPRKTIVDIAGLNDRDFALASFSADRLFARVRPDLIYMPHPDYDAMVRELEGAFARDARYEVFPAGQLGSAFGIALDRESRHYDALRALVEKCPSRKVQ